MPHRLALIAVALILSFLSPSLHAQHPAGFGGKKLDVPPIVGPAGPQDFISANSSTPQWIDGTFTFNWGLNCIVIGNNYEEVMITGFTGYYGAPDLSYPKVGQRYYGRIFVSIPGNACIDGITDAYLWIKLPTDTQFAISQADPVKCYYASTSTGNVFEDVTGQAAAACPNSPSGPDGGGFYYLNARNLAQGAQFQIVFPIVSTKVKSGISDAGSKMTGAISSSDTPNTVSRPNNDPQYPHQWVWVTANSPTLDYPTPAATNITNTTARTFVNVANHYTPGSVYFDLGTTLAYGTTIGPLAVPNTFDSVQGYTDWAALLPGTAYQWRGRFVHAGGTVTGANRTFTTTGVAPPPPTGVRGDFNGDGKPDLLWRNYTTGVVNVWFLNGTAYTGGATLFTVADPNWRIEGTGDFNGDGKTDLIWRNYSTGVVNVWFLNGTSYLGGATLFTVAVPHWKIEAVGDFNGDGKSDLIWRNYSTGAVNAWFMNGATYTGGATMFTVVDPNWKIEVAGDFNGDGKTDLIWRNYSTGAVNVWFLNGTSYIGGATLFTVADPNWRIEAVGDYNGDAKLDLIWRNYASGVVNVWFLNGTTYSGGSSLFTVAGAQWEIAGPR